MSRVKELIRLSGRRALVTGALGGLGRVVSKTLAELGADIVLVDRPGNDFSGLKAELSNWQVKVTAIPCDIEIEDERRLLIENIKADGGTLSILVNNAAFVGTTGLAGWAVPFEDQSVETWRRALEVNLTAAFDFCQGLAPLLRRSSGSSVINVASMYGFLGPDWQLYEGTNMSNPAAYAVSKGGLIQLTRWLATTLSPEVRVNAISPGGIARNQPATFVERYEQKTPLRRMATEEDFVGIVAFLASDMSRYVTGQNHMIDGGWSTW